jgi:hypothetical protein
MVGGCRYPLSEELVVRKVFEASPGVAFDNGTGQPLGGLDDQLIVTQGFCFVNIYILNSLFLT